MFVAASLLASATPALAKGFIAEDDLPTLQKADPKESCVVAAVIFGGGIGEFKGASLAFGKSALPMTTPGLNRALTGDGFAFVDVPKGPFRISMISWSEGTGKYTPGGIIAGKPIHVVTAFGPKANIHAPMEPQDSIRAGDVPVEMSGTCNGGFIWLGLFKATKGGMAMPPTLALGNDSVAEEEPLRTISGQLKGTPWEAAFAARVKNVPLDPKTVVGQDAMGGFVKPTRAKTKTTFKLLNPGAEPRRELRYAPVEGAKRACVLGVITGNLPGTNELQAQLRFTLDTTTVKVAESAPWKYTFNVVKSESAPTKNKTAAMIAKLMTTDTDGTTGFVQIDERATMCNGDYALPPGKKPMGGPLLNYMGSIVVPFPEEAVGVGASWQAEVLAQAQGAVSANSTTQLFTYKLESLTGDSAKISFTVDGKTVPSKPVQMGNAKLVGTTVKGTGEAKINLTKLVPDWYKLHTVGEAQFVGKVDHPLPPSTTEVTLEGR